MALKVASRVLGLRTSAALRSASSKAYRWLGAHQLISVLLIVTIVAGAGFLRIEQMFSCAQSYAEKSYAASDPVRDAAALLAAADDEVWKLTLKVFTQNATPNDYDALRDAIYARTALSAKLKDARAAHPIPDPPRTFC